MRAQESPRSQTWIDVPQDLTGVSVRQVGRYLGVVVASAWFWTAARPPGFTALAANAKTPVEWAGDWISSVGFSDRWAQSLTAWLANYPTVFWLLIFIAVLAGSLALQHRAPSTLVFIPLLLAISAQGLIPVIAAYLGCTFLLAVAAGVSDFLSRNEHGGRVGGLGWPLYRWFSGPALLLVLVPLGPLVLLLSAIRPYRVEDDDELVLPGLEFAAAVEKLPHNVKDLSPRELVRVLSAAQLMSAHHSDWDREVALRRLLNPRHRPEPPGATTLPQPRS